MARALDESLGATSGTIAIESFFSSLKSERTARKMHRTGDEAKAAVLDDIERVYKPEKALCDRESKPDKVRAEAGSQVPTKPQAGRTSSRF
jgi:hypothetical protein